MQKIHVNTMLGISGVAAQENERAKRWGQRFEIPMILLAIWIVIEWYAETVGIISIQLAMLTDWLIWLFFILETVVLTSLVSDKKKYLFGNWLNVFIILMGIPILWGVTIYYAGVLRSLRLLVMITLFVNLSATIKSVLSRNSLGLVLGVALFIILISGVLIAGIDPAIETPWQGIWWAWVTVTTVGYGDIVPESPAGKVFAALLILLGVALFSLMTASFSAFFIAREEEEVLKEEEKVLKEETLTLKKLEIIERHLKAIDKRLDEISERKN